MIDTDKYEGHTPAYLWRKADGSAMSMQSANNNADAELMADAPLLLAEVKRLLEENNRYLDFIFWLGIEHKGKELAWEYGDEKIVEML